MTTKANSVQTSKEKLVEYLQELLNKEDRRALAVLRRAISNEGIDFSAYTIVGSRISSKIPPRDHKAHLLTACLFALHQIPTNQGQSLGYSTRLLRNNLKAGQDNLDRRFATILNAHEEDLGVHLRHLFSLLKANDISVDYSKLLRDLRHWHFETKRVQTQWAQDYWVGEENENDTQAIDKAS